MCPDIMGIIKKLNGTNVKYAHPACIIAKLDFNQFNYFIHKFYIYKDNFQILPFLMAF